ncbi:hypothetical protein G6R29_03380 [Fructobacillus sp. M2-14]|uniref:Uncharacterized protein n=1 Tax=Fructobacillus broussonetiae TaxID=2713173 RepID=A0ABS5QZQ4_9LACO|nr:hypothetical protein [Fructobacillus broussonetiae]MBS9338673.1 hypothetical protein [Fructobacillus broussonetiae]
MIYPLKKRQYLPVLSVIIFFILSIMLRFNVSLLTMVDAIFSIGIQALASTKIGLLLIPAYVLKDFWFIWILYLIWAAFLRALGYKVGFWWTLACVTILIGISWGWSLLTFFYWDDGPVMLQMMPSVSLVSWVFFLFQVQQILVVRLRLAAWVKKVIGWLLALVFVLCATASIVEYDMSSSTVLGSVLFGYAFFRLSATLYITQGKHWQQFFGVDGKI